jgi:hypothetical protein
MKISQKIQILLYSLFSNEKIIIYCDTNNNNNILDSIQNLKYI